MTETKAAKQAKASEKAGVRRLFDIRGRKHRRQLAQHTRDLDLVAHALELRSEVLLAAAEDLRKIGFKDEALALASTDLFVEKAQQVLTSRAAKMSRSGWAATAVTIVLLVIGVLVTTSRLLAPLAAGGPGDNELILRVFQATALGAFVFAGVKYLIALARSFFHESVVLLDRRHALRFGRLNVYLSRGDLGFNETVEAFQWNRDTASSFLDLKPELLAETILHKIVELGGKLPSGTADAARRVGTAMRPASKP